MSSMKPSPPRKFEPARIPPFSVIRAPLAAGEEELGEKLVVVLGHAQGHAICLKATSNTSLYLNNPERMAGCVYYKAGELSCFKRDTIVQPDNQFPVAHSRIDCAERVLGKLPSDFPQKLRTAIENSSTMTENRKRSILGLLASACT